MNDANYQKHNDRTHNSSTYHKKDGTPVRARLKREADKTIAEDTDSASIEELEAAAEIWDSLNKEI